MPSRTVPPIDIDLIDTRGTRGVAKHALINYATQTTPGEVIAAVAGKRILVLMYDFVVAGAVTVQFQDDTGTPVVLLPAQSYAANSGKSSSFCPVGHFGTSVGKALDIVLGGAVQVSGVIVYVEVDG